jgi:hypothetical protein
MAAHAMPLETAPTPSLGQRSQSLGRGNVDRLAIRGSAGDYRHHIARVFFGVLGALFFLGSHGRLLL